MLKKKTEILCKIWPKAGGSISKSVSRTYGEPSDSGLTDKGHGVKSCLDPICTQSAVKYISN